jgi:peptidoglycan/LPS O-acetylase OafA/YrhL
MNLITDQKPIAIASREASLRSMVGLDLLRGFAALIVLIGHVRGASFVEYGALPKDQQGFISAAFFGVSRLGHEAVLIFFVLSGFLVGGQIIRSVRAGTFDIKPYVIDRSTRILTPLIPACVLTAILSFSMLHQSPSITQIISNMVGLNDVLAPTFKHNAPLWSLSYEIWFYVFGGVLGYIFYKDISVLSFCVLMCCLAVFSILDARLLLYWGMGAVTILFLSSRYQLSLAVPGLVLAMLGAFSYELATESKSFATVQYIPKSTAELLICAGVCLVIPSLCNSKVDSFLSHIRVPAFFLASISYTLYLVHYPINATLEIFFPKAAALSLASLGTFGLKIVICLCVTLIFYYLFEGRTGTLRRYIRAAV